MLIAEDDLFVDLTSGKVFDLEEIFEDTPEDSIAEYPSKENN